MFHLWSVCTYFNFLFTFEILMKRSFQWVLFLDIHSYKTKHATKFVILTLLDRRGLWIVSPTFIHSCSRLCLTVFRFLNYEINDSHKTTYSHFRLTSQEKKLWGPIKLFLGILSENPNKKFFNCVGFTHSVRDRMPIEYSLVLSHR